MCSDSLVCFLFLVVLVLLIVIVCVLRVQNIRIVSLPCKKKGPCKFARYYHALGVCLLLRLQKRKMIGGFIRSLLLYD